MVLAIGHELGEIAEGDQLWSGQDIAGTLLQLGNRVCQTMSAISRVNPLGKLFSDRSRRSAGLTISSTFASRPFSEDMMVALRGVPARIAISPKQAPGDTEPTLVRQTGPWPVKTSRSASTEK